MTLMSVIGYEFHPRCYKELDSIETDDRANRTTVALSEDRLVHGLRVLVMGQMTTCMMQAHLEKRKLFVGLNERWGFSRCIIGPILRPCPS